MSRQPIGITRAGRVLAIAACSLVLVAGCTRAQPPDGAIADSGTESVQATEPTTQPPTSSDESSSPSSSTSPSTGGGGSSGSSGSSSSTAGNGGGNGGGGNGGSGDGGNQAPGSPIDVPTIPSKHVHLDDIRAEIRNQFITACGGHDLCVKLVYDPTGPCFAGYDPADRAERGSTVRVLTESQEDCDRANGLDGSGSSTDGTTPDSGSTTDVPSSGTSTSPTDVPGSGPSDSGTGGGSPDNGQPDGSTG